MKTKHTLILATIAFLSITTTFAQKGTIEKDRWFSAIC